MSLLYSKQSSLEEEEKEERFSVGSKGTSKSHESLATLKSGSGSATPAKLLSPAGSMSVSVPVMNDMPTGSASKTMKTTARIGKPPNILILCEDEKRRMEISAVLKNLLSNDRYNSPSDPSAKVLLKRCKLVCFSQVCGLRHPMGPTRRRRMV